VVAGLAAAFLLQAITLGGRVQSGVTVVPDTVTVGDPFEVRVRVRAPRGAIIVFPEAPDSGGAVEPLDPVQVTPNTDTTATDQIAVYRVAAWDVGSRPIGFPDVLVRQDVGVRLVRLAEVSVFVRSVLPADSAERVPKPARGLITFGLPWWFWVLLALVAAAIVALLWWLWKRRRPPSETADPFEQAQRAFARVESLGLVAAGERTRHVALMVEVMRDYLAAVVPSARTSLTSVELLAVLRGDLPGITKRLASLLAEADLVKFAAKSVSAERANSLGREARAAAEAMRALQAAAAAAAAAPALERAA
jgi:hypothetical protein